MKWFLLCILGALLLVELPAILSFRKTNPSTTKFMELRKKEGPIAHSWVPLDQISPFFVETIFFTEDQDFYSHHGLSWRKIHSSFRANQQAKQVIHGGSTITQQVAKNLFLSPKKSYFRKAREAMIAIALELALSKKRILEIYLNTMELGPGIFGIEAAAQHWFQCCANDLSAKEAVDLALIASNPITRNPLCPSPYFKSLRTYILTLLAGKEMITYEEMVASIL